MEIVQHDATKLLGGGTSVMLGGTRVPIVFDQEAFVLIEERWGSLNAFAEELQKGHKGKMYTCVRDAIVATVRNLPVDPAKLMDPKRIVEYAEAIGPAFMKAMPDVAQEEAAGARKPDAPLTGELSSTSESSDSGWRPPTSGE